MIRKRVVKLLETAFKKVSNAADMHTKLNVRTMSRLDMVRAGELEISATTAMLIETHLGINAMELLTAQAADHLEQVGYKFD